MTKGRTKAGNDPTKLNLKIFKLFGKT